MELSSSWTFGIKAIIVLIYTVNILVVVNAIVSARTLGGQLGLGLKKIAAGTICHVVLFTTIYFIEQGYKGIFDENQIRLLFLSANFIGSVLLILGYTQIYQISKKLRLF